MFNIFTLVDAITSSRHCWSARSNTAVRVESRWCSYSGNNNCYVNKLINHMLGTAWTKLNRLNTIREMSSACSISHIYSATFLVASLMSPVNTSMPNEWTVVLLRIGMWSRLKKGRTHMYPAGPFHDLYTVPHLWWNVNDNTTVSCVLQTFFLAQSRRGLKTESGMVLIMMRPIGIAKGM